MVRWTCILSWTPLVNNSIPSSSAEIPAPTVQQLVSELSIVAVKWHALGVRLALPISKLNEFESSNNSGGAERKLTAMFEYYVNNFKPSWINVCDKVEDIGYKKRADELREKYKLRRKSDKPKSATDTTERYCLL